MALTLVTSDLIGGLDYSKLTGTVPTWNQNTTGSAATLTTARNIGGVSFNGSAAINLPGVNAAGNQNTSGTAAGLSATLAVGSGGTGVTSITALKNVLDDETWTFANNTTFGGSVTADQGIFDSTANTYAGGSLILRDLNGGNPMYLTSVVGSLAISNGGSADHLLIASSGLATFTGDIALTGDSKIQATADLGIGARNGTTNAGAVYIGGANDNPFISPTAFFGTDGNVGIGTTSPTAKLQIHTATNAGNPEVAAFLVNESTTTNTEVRLAFAAHTNDIISTGRYSYISAKNTSGSNGQDLVFATNATGASATPKLTISSSGNVGINNGQSRGKITIGDNSSGAVTRGIVLENRVANAQGTGSSIEFYVNTGDNDRCAIIQSVQETAGNYANLEFFTANNGAPTKRLTITSGGVVNINTTGSGTQKLQVIGGIQMWYDTNFNRSTKVGYDGIYITGSQNGYLYSPQDWVFWAGGSEKMRLASGGNLSIGSTANNAKFFVYGNNHGGTGYYLGYFYNDGNGQDRYGVRINGGANDGSGTTVYLRCDDGDATEVGGLKNVSGTFQLFDSSDISLKENIEDTDIKGLERVNALKVRKFNWKKNGILNVAGFVAQEVENVIPEASSPMDSGLLSVSVTSMVPTLVKAIQEQQDQIELLKQEVELLKNK